MSSVIMPPIALPSITEEWKFITMDKLPHIEGNTSFQQVYAQLSRRGFGGFILSQNGELVNYVKGPVLATEVVRRANGDAQVLRRYSDETIANVIAEISTPSVLVPILSPQPGATEAQLRNHSDAVFRIVGPDGSVGWYLNHEDVRTTATTKTVFICKNGHRNSDPDHGTCYSCPFPITRTETE